MNKVIAFVLLFFASTVCFGQGAEGAAGGASTGAGVAVGTGTAVTGVILAPLAVLIAAGVGHSNFSTTTHH